jgi:hypothetical protein
MTTAGDRTGGAAHPQVRYRVMLAKKEERTIGPDASDCDCGNHSPDRSSHGRRL